MVIDEPGRAATRSAPPLPILQRWGPPGTAVVLGVGALVLLLIGAILGLALAPSRTSANPVGGQPGAVDFGFSRDMIVHHTQGVSMANLAELHTQDNEVRVTAFDISSTQQTDIGELSGWLDLWGVARISPDEPMTWMTGSAGQAGMHMGGATTAGSATDAADGAAADGAVMPGMATNTEMSKLRSLTGTASDVYFLQLMIRHHQGGAAMTQYAAAHASLPVVRNFAGKMLNAQANEISLMTQMLQERKAQPLPFTPPVIPTG